MIRDHKLTAEENFPMSEQGYTTDKLLDGTECQILLDTRASKPFMSKSHCLLQAEHGIKSLARF